VCISWTGPSCSGKQSPFNVTRTRIHLVVLDELLEGQEVGVPAAVLVHAEDEVLALGERGKLLGLLHGRGDGLLNHDLASITIRCT
jgi:hypothetical protein